MTGPLYRLGHFSARHRIPVIALWLLVVVALMLVSRSVGSQLNDDVSMPNTDSDRATQLLEREFPKQANGTNPIAFEAAGGKRLDEGEYRSAITESVKALEADPDVESAPNPTDPDSPYITKDGRIAQIPLILKPDASELSEEEAEHVIEVASEPLEAAGLDPAAGGYLGQKVSRPETRSSEVLGLIVALIVLLFTFGTAVAMGIPIFTALLGVLSGVSIIGLLGQVTDVPSVAPTLGTMIGLGVGIDYALFIVSRHREQLEQGMPMRESIARAIATAGGAVVFAGGTVMIALLSLMAAGIPLLSTLGWTAGIVVLIAITGAVTALPAALALIDRRIDSLPVPFVGHKSEGAEGHGWERFAHVVSDHPWPAVVGSIVVLVAMAVPVLDLHLGQTDTSAMPEETQVRQSYDLMTDGFGEGSNGPMLVVSSLDPKAQNDQKQLDELNAEVEKQQAQQEQAVQDLVLQGVPPEQAQAQVAAEADEDKQAETEQKQDFLASPASDPRLQDLRTAMEKQDGVGSVSQPVVNDSGDAALYNLVPAQAPADLKTEDAVSALRDDVIPKATEGDGMEVHVGGRTAGFIDLAQKIADKLLFVILLVVALSFVVLMFAFRSVVVPLKAGLMNLLSVAAAFGVVTLVFQEGFMVEAIGLEEAIPIVSFVPLIMFAILFGLSMDYEVFLMTHVQERYLKTKDNRDAVIYGIATTGRLITSAALIMVAVFGSFILSGDPQVKQFGVGLSVAIAVDATIVRCLLVPAIMTLLGDRNWYMPRWLDRHTPKISIEGDEYFADRPVEEVAR